MCILEEHTASILSAEHHVVAWYMGSNVLGNIAAVFRIDPAVVCYVSGNISEEHTK